ncbi:hypothetical protein CFC21_051927 [Triticum aestivum]|uniref:Uncharacterized protein n=1 Tax=Triticum aestivum TaxID=4565 RepID=A0A9R1G890_WHEAT|nr:hypothetical protein CFC21_051927 [Triticum aestivum]
MAARLHHFLLLAALLLLIGRGAPSSAGAAGNGKHGPEECLLNTVEACAIDAWPDVNVHFGFINCVEGLVMNEIQGEWESCFHKLGLEPKAVTECYKSEHGHKEDGEFVSYVCKAYKGRPPKICHEPDRHYPTVVEAGNGVSYNPADFKLEDGVEVPRTDDN